MFGRLSLGKEVLDVAEQDSRRNIIYNLSAHTKGIIQVSGFTSSGADSSFL
jgi:hypothetical protein